MSPQCNLMQPKMRTAEHSRWGPGWGCTLDRSGSAACLGLEAAAGLHAAALPQRKVRVGEGELGEIRAGLGGRPCPGIRVVGSIDLRHGHLHASAGVSAPPRGRSSLSAAA